MKFTEMSVASVLRLALICPFLIQVSTATRSNSEIIYINPSNALTNQTLPDYGEACNATTGCKDDISLVCDPVQKTCTCSKPEDMFVSYDKRQCVTYVERRCRYAVIEDGRADEGINGTVRVETTTCVNGAACNKTGFCQCNLGFQEVRSRTYNCNKSPCQDRVVCGPSAGFDSRCNSQLECDVTKMLACIDKKCKCFQDGMEAVPEEWGTTCKIKLGSSCHKLQMQNSTPVVPIFKDENAKDRTFYGDEEEASRQIQEIYAIAQCIDGSYCSSDTGLCTCSPGLFLNSETGTCALKGLGVDCLANAECDTAKLLICQNGKCNCGPELSVPSSKDFAGTTLRNGRIFFGKMKSWVSATRNILETCLSKVGGSCSTINFERKRDSLQCVVGADCDLSVKKCLCFNGREPMNGNTTCGRPFGEICSRTELCLDGLACKSMIGSTDMKCGCPNTKYQIYDRFTTSLAGRNGSCRGLVGTICSPVDPNGCVNNSQCVVNIGNGSSITNNLSKCRCKLGFVENSAQQCDIEYGQPCNSSMTSICDTLAELECRVVKNETALHGSGNREICSCPNTDDVYDKENKRCGRPLNFPCGSDKDCVSMAMCKKEGHSQIGTCVGQHHKN